MAIQRNKVAPSANPDVINVNEAGEVPTNVAASGPVGVPDASTPASGTPEPAKRRGAPHGPRGPQLDWGFVINGEVLRKTLVEIARKVSAEHGGYATLGNLVDAVKSHPSFTENAPDGIPLSELATTLNVRSQWSAMRDKFIVQFSSKPVDQGGLGLTLPAMEDKETEKGWVNRCKNNLLTDSQWSQMEDAIARPKPEGLNFPKLIVRRGRRASSLDMSDI